ncbi:RNA polymerase factor sigma-54 [Nitrococcus mobilis]|uniref:RNA polymerase sigma-54 factor n=1 Tax=Nitrococcus mobilis Nb-231 TaxID=314278 RepID=A4BQM1_9GAMM|nr:RNA polymerase factor sigma-54 [Nitrococcus mobilis]EAR21871.1 DNA-directed RNA polymerase subunit N [Nitrococcus mobilis Nb-231]
MKQSLQLRLRQQLTMTPQLQQAIRLLQLPALELRMEIQQALESNLMLELAEEADTSFDETELLVSPSEREHETELGAAGSGQDNEGTVQNEQIGDELPLDTSWEDVYDGTTIYSDPGYAEERDPFANQSEGGQSLQDYLTWQAQLNRFSTRELTIAEAIIDAVRDDGYLGCSLAEIHTVLPEQWGVSEQEIETVLTQIQRFDPVGVAARDPREALLVQLDQLDPETPWLEAARQLIDRHLGLVAKRQFAQLKRRLHLDEQALQQTLALVQTLDPRPGLRISSERPEYITPDVFVRKENGHWRVEVNPDAYPCLRVNSQYAGLVRRGDNSRDNSVMRQHLQEARWLIKSLHSRNETLLKVAQCIVERQQDFLEYGEEAMKPLVLREVAEAINMHESTVSRITSQKYLRAPSGTYEFKHFFSSHVQTVDGGECSATSIRARIRRLIAAEDASRPLSDSQLAEQLQADGINVARRTVAKYRESMSIASSTERRRFA